MKKMLAAVSMAVASLGLFGGNTLNVPADYSDLAAAIEAAHAGDEIVLAAGSHQVTSGLTLDAGVTLRGETDRPEDTTLIAGNPATSITLLTLNAAEARVCNLSIDANADFTKTGCRLAVVFGDNGGAVSNCVIRNGLVNQSGLISHSGVKMTAAATVTHCVISNCWGILSRTDYHDSANVYCLGRLSNCLITGNRVDGDKMAIVQLAGTGRMENCTIAGNTAYASTTKHVLISGADARAVNCAIAANVFAGKATVAATAGDALYSKCVSDGTALGADGVVSTATDMFADPYSREWAPRAGGPLVDMGQTLEAGTTTDLAGAARVSGQGIDIGAYELDTDAFAVTFSADRPQVPLPATITFTAAVGGCDPSVALHYDWDFDGDGAVDKTTDSPVCAHDFTSVGCLTVGLTVRDDDGRREVSLVKRDYLRLLPATLHVVQGNPNAAEPYDTVANAAADIQTAIDFAVAGCAVQIDDPTYTLPATAPVTLAKGVTLRGSTTRPEGTTLIAEWRTADTSFTMLTLDAAGAKVCDLSIDANANLAQTGFWTPVAFGGAGGCVSNCVIRNAFVNKTGLKGYAGVWMTDAATVTHCVISNFWGKNSRTDGYLCAGVYCPGRLSNCLIVGNRVDTGNMAIVQLVGTGRMENCTFVDNNAYASPTKHIRIDGTDARAVNCAVAANVFAGQPAVEATAGNALYSNCVSDGTALGTDGVVSTAADMFGNAAIGDWTPKSKGPLVDKCDPDESMPETDLAGSSRQIGAAVDIGAFELDTSKFSIGFSADTVEAPIPADVTFSASTTGCDDGDDICFYWDLDGDGDTDAVSSESWLPYRYEAFGTFDVTLTVTNFTKGASANLTIGRCLRLLPATLHVVQGNPNAAEPYDTIANAAADIQTAIDFAVAGCAVQIDDPTYTLPATAPLTLAKGVTLKGSTTHPEGTTLIAEWRTADTSFTMLTLDAAGAKVCNLSIDANANLEQTGFWTPIAFEGAGGCISNCVIRNAFANNSALKGYAGVWMTDAATVTHCVISNCWIKNSRTDGYLCAGVYCPGRLSNCLIVGNRVDTGNMAIVQLVGTGRMENCTFVDNNAYASPTKHIRIDGTDARAVNCAVAANVFAGQPAVEATAGNALYSNCVSDGTALGTDGVVSTAADMFADPIGGEWAPRANGRLVDAGKAIEGGPVTDLAGAARVSGQGIDIGAYELDADKFAVTFSADRATALLPARITFTVAVSGSGQSDTLYFDWDFNGDGKTDETTISSVCTHEFTSVGYATVGLTVRNETQERTATQLKRNFLRFLPATLHVVQGNPNAAEPYDTAENAASNVQMAIDFAIPGCSVQIDDGTYVLPVSTPIAIEKDVTLQGSTSCPEGTTLIAEWRTATTSCTMLRLDAAGAKVCNLSVDANANTVLGNSYWTPVTFGNAGGCVSNCVIRNAFANYDNLKGYAGVWMTAAATVSHCVISNCWGKRSRTDYYDGANIYCPGRLSNCLIVGNRVDWDKMAIVQLADAGRMENCTIVANTVCASTTKHILVSGADARVVNCVVVANMLEEQPGLAVTEDVTAYSHCLSDEVKLGADGILANAADIFRLRGSRPYDLLSNSPARDHGEFLPWMIGASDLYGRPRIFGKSPDIGCAESQTGGFQVIVR